MYVIGDKMCFDSPYNLCMKLSNVLSKLSISFRVKYPLLFSDFN